MFTIKPEGLEFKEPVCCTARGKVKQREREGEGEREREREWKLQIHLHLVESGSSCHPEFRGVIMDGFFSRYLEEDVTHVVTLNPYHSHNQNTTKAQTTFGP